MLQDLQNLMEVQVADKEILRLKEEVAALPKRVAVIEQKLAATKAKLEKAKATAKADETAKKKYETAIVDVQGKISKYRDQSLAVKTNDQYKALMQLEIEKQALKKEDDANSRERLAVIDKELAEIREKSNALKAAWKQEKDLIARQRGLKEKLEQLRIEEQTEERKGNLQRVAEIRYGLIRQTEEELKKLTSQLEKTSARRMSRTDSTFADCAKAVQKRMTVMAVTYTIRVIF